MPPHRLRCAVLRLLARGLGWVETARRLGYRKGNLMRVCRRYLPPLPATCSRCGRPARCYHHVTYVPERVQSLCRSCHRLAHAYG